MELEWPYKESEVFAPLFPKKTPQTFLPYKLTKHAIVTEVVGIESGKTPHHSISQKSSWGTWKPSIRSQVFYCSIIQFCPRGTDHTLATIKYFPFNSTAAKISQCEESPALSLVFILFLEMCWTTLSCNEKKKNNNNNTPPHLPYPNGATDL